MNSTVFNEDQLNTQEKASYFLQPGYIFASKEPHLVSTVLGSCVSVCIWDSVLGFGGMNHYLQAKPLKNENTAKFGSVAIPHLINTMIKMGSLKHNLKAHVVGGSQNIEKGSIKVGKENIKIAEVLLKANYIDIVTFDAGGELGRKIVFDNSTGEIAIYKVKSLRDYDWYDDKSTNSR